MSIVSSQITLNNLQIDGRRIIREEHIDDSGNIFDYDYIADSDIDINARMSERIPAVLAESDALLAAQAEGS